MNRSSRLASIVRILENGRVGDQESLRKKLARSGFPVSQASLSRDLTQLGAQRVRGSTGEYCYTLPRVRPVASSKEGFRRRFADSVQEVRRCQFLILLLTPPGEASFVGELLDQARLSDLAGTVAGDDTVLVVTKDIGRAKRLEEKFKEMVA